MSDIWIQDSTCHCCCVLTRLRMISYVNVSEAMGPSFYVIRPHISYICRGSRGWAWRLVRQGLNWPSLLVQWPKVVLEHTLRVVLPLQLRQTRPVLPKASHRPHRRLVPADKLRVHSASRPADRAADVPMGTARRARPCLWCRRSTGTVCQHAAHGEQTRTRTSSADSMHRGSSMPISHWCKAATVHTASRCSFGIGVSSKSAMAPPDSSKSHAATDNQPSMSDGGKPQ